MTVVRFRRPRTWHKPVIATVVVGLTISLAAFAGWHGKVILSAGGNAVASAATDAIPSLGRYMSQLRFNTNDRDTIYVIDGDTLDIGNERIQLENIDAPEVGIHAACPSERRRGARAARHARRLLVNANDIQIDRHYSDVYGRTLARIRLDGRDMGLAMIQDGHARYWTGARRRWCTRQEIREAREASRRSSWLW